MSMPLRSAWQVTWSVWRALFIRDAMGRLFGRRAAWLWILAEPVLQIGFMILIFTTISIRQVGGIDAAVWLMVGFLGFFMFRRTLTLSMAAVQMSKVLFTYRQVKPVDTVLVRGATEGLLMLVISVLILLVGALFKLPVLPEQPLLVLISMFALWYMAMGFGLLLSIPRVLVKEIENLVNLILTPLYFISGVLVSVDVIPLPYRNILIANPVSHAIDSLRAGFSTTYQPFHEMSLFYCFVVGTVCTCLGLMLHRVYAQRLIEL